MNFQHFSQFPDFELLDSGNGYRLERWADYILARPDPQAIWQKHLPEDEWRKAHATFNGRWQVRHKIQQPWNIRFPFPLAPGEAKTGDWEITLNAKLTPFKHTGIFAEQAAHWEWMVHRVQNKKSQTKGEELRILNLFGYTGGASIVLAKLGCFVTHVDASKPAIAWAKENQASSNLPENSIRWILDDAVKFVKRELKRGAHYDGIIMDPPAFGHSPTGKTWKFSEDFPKLLHDINSLLSPQANFLVINAYATNSSALALQNVVEDTITKPGKLDSGELCLQQRDGRMLSTGIFVRWSS